MKEVAMFKKVSKQQFGATLRTLYPDFEFTTKNMDIMYDNIKIPARSTTGAAGYDFHTPFPFTLYPGSKIWIPTGVRVEIKEEGWHMIILPQSRSAKTSMKMANTIGLIDNDYYYADNEGHIMIVLELPGEMSGCGKAIFGRHVSNEINPVTFESGDKIGQGIFIECGIVMNEDPTKLANRTGGYGSTGSK